MAVLKSIYFDTSNILNAAAPNNNVISKNYDTSDFTIVKECTKSNGSKGTSNGAWFWAKLKTRRGTQGIVGAYYLVYIKTRNNGTFYGTKYAAPEPPFTGQDNPADNCEI